MTAFGIGRDRAADTEELGAMIYEAMRRHTQGSPRTAERLVRQVAQRSFDAYGRSIVQRILDDMLEDRIGIAWQDGWQPVDLDRYVARRLGRLERAVLGDAMAAHLAQYAAATVDQDWWDQLDAQDARVWWPADQSFVRARTATEDWEALVLACVRLIAEVWIVPPIERLGPTPGTATPRSSRGRGDVEPRILERVRRLLAKAESTTFEAEAETFTAGAQALMARHSIDAALLASSAPDAESPDASRLGIESPYELQKVLLLDKIATANSCRTVWSKELGHATLVGHHEDRLAVETLFTSLLVQATTAMTQQGKRTDARGRSRTTAFRRSFLSGFATRIGQRLEEAIAAEVSTIAEERRASGGGQELVPLLTRRREAVDAALDELFPSLRTHSGGTISDGEGWAVGTAAADQASLDRGRQVEGG